MHCMQKILVASFLILLSLPIMGLDRSDEDKPAQQSESYTKKIAKQLLRPLGKKISPAINIKYQYGWQYFKIEMNSELFELFFTKTEKIPCEDTQLRQKSKVETSLGFLIDAAEGILCTNSAVGPNNAGGSITVTSVDGEQSYPWADIEILGITPSLHHGFYIFLRIKKLANKYPQIPLDLDNAFKKEQVVYTIKAPLRSNVECFVSRGVTTDPFRLTTEQFSRGEHSASVCFDSEFQLLGSPVFNDQSQIIGLTATCLSKEGGKYTVTPIWYVNRHLRQIKAGQPITSYELGYPLVVCPDISYIKEILGDDYKNYSRQSLEEKDQFLVVKPVYIDPKKSDEDLQMGDILLTINGLKAGINPIRLSNILMNNPNQPVLVKVLRDCQIITLSIMPKAIIQRYLKYINVDGVPVYSSDGFFSHHYNIEPGKAIKIPEEAGLIGNGPYIIDRIDTVLTPTFDDFVIELHDLIENQKKDYFCFYGASFALRTGFTGHTINNMTRFDPSKGMTLYVVQFNLDTHQWEKIDYKDYVELLLNRCPQDPNL